MAKDLTVSVIERQNILNNSFAIHEIEKAINLKGIIFENRFRFVKQQVAEFFEVTSRTIDNCIEKNLQELLKNGYEVLRGKRLKSFALSANNQFVSEIDFVNKKTRQLAVFDFRAFVDIAMLLRESERARLLRKTILDIVIDTLNTKTGGGTKYINQRDEDFILAYFQEENYRKEFTDALRDCVDMGNFKYPLYTDKIYVSIFRENAHEYRKILKLHTSDKVRDTFYSEILDLVASFEYGFACLLSESFIKKGHKLSTWEVDELFAVFEKQPHWKPLVERARVKMASRDLAFRDALHRQLKEYIYPVNADEFERFLGEMSKELAERLEDAKDVMKRLKERE